MPPQVFLFIDVTNNEFMNKLFSIILLCFGIVSCAPTQSENTGPQNTTITPKYEKNISTLFGSGGLITNDSQNIYQESDIVWKDSLGNKHSLAELKGKIVLLNFWATWCKYCEKEMPDLQSIQDSMGKFDVVVIGVSVDRGDLIYSHVKDYVEFWNVKFQIVIDPPATTYFNYKCSDGLPWTFLIDRDGNIVTKYVGLKTKEQFIEGINTIL